MPPLGYALLAALLVGLVLVTLFTGLAPLRHLGRTFNPTRAERDLRRALLVACSGVGAIAGGALAVGLAGPGALPWVWVASLFGAGIVHAEVALSARFRRRDEGGRWSFGLAEALLAQGERGTSILAFGVAITAGLAALVFGGGFQSAQIAGALSLLAEAEPLTVGALLAGLVAPFLIGPAALRQRLRRGLLRFGPALIGIYVGFAGILLLSRPSFGETVSTMFNDAVRFESMAAGGLGGAIGIAMLMGLVRTVMATQLGLGTAGALEEIRQVEDPDRAGAAVMTVPVLVGLLVTTVTGLLVAASGEAPLETLDARRGPNAEMIYLERAEGVGLEPNLDLGQLVVLDDDSELEVGRRYPMRLRANPRGHGGSGVLLPDDNAIRIARWSNAQAVSTVVFRDKDLVRARNPAFDVRVEVERVEERDEQGRVAIMLRPVDPEVDLAALAQSKSGPFVVLEDFRFQAGVGELGDGRKAIYMERDPEWPLDPVLRQLTVDMGFRGPFPDTAASDAHPPWGFIAREELDEPIGRVIRLRMRAPDRGLDPDRVGKLVAVRPELLGDELQPNERELRSIGELRTPPWDFLAGATHVVLRSTEDPSLDLRYRVRVRRAEDGALAFRSHDPTAIDFAQIMVSGLKGYEGPFLVAPDYELDVVVRSGARLPATLASHRVLVPLGVPPEPIGPPGDGALYRPHPHELLLAGMEGPYRLREGLPLVAAAVDRSSGSGSGALGVALFTLLGLASMAIMGAAGGRHLGRVFGPGADLGFRLAFLAMVGLMPGLGASSALVGMVDLTLLLALAFEGTALAILARSLVELGED